jgi:hypothetical protein
MIIKVIKNAYYVSENLTNLGLIDQNLFESSFSHLLVIGDIWKKIDDESNFSEDIFECIEGEWVGEKSDGWWDYKGIEGYFEIIES